MKTVFEKDVTIYHIHKGIDGPMLQEAFDTVSEDGFFIRTLTKPGLRLLSALRGPKAGDPDVTDLYCYFAKREGRDYEDRMTLLPGLWTNEYTVIGSKDGPKYQVYTAHPGPAACRNPEDPSIETEDERVEAEQFWKVHALAF